MKNIVRFAISALALSLLLVGCNRDNVDKGLEAKKNFLTLTEYGVFANGNYTFAYNEKDYQIAFDEEDNTVRLQKDDMSSYIIIELDSAPTMGAIVKADVSGKGISTANGVEMEVVKTTSDGVWLWDKKAMTGYIIYWEF